MRSRGAPLGSTGGDSVLLVHPFLSFVAVRRPKPPMAGLPHQHVSEWAEVWRSPPPPPPSGHPHILGLLWVLDPRGWSAADPSCAGSSGLTFVPGQRWWQFWGPNNRRAGLGHSEEGEGLWGTLPPRMEFRIPASSSCPPHPTATSRSGMGTPVPAPPPPSATSTPAGQPTAITRLHMQLHLHDLQQNASDLRNQLQQLKKLQVGTGGAPNPTPGAENAPFPGDLMQGSPPSPALPPL